MGGDQSARPDRTEFAKYPTYMGGQAEFRPYRDSGRFSRICACASELRRRDFGLASRRVIRRRVRDPGGIPTDRP